MDSHISARDHGIQFRVQVSQHVVNGSQQLVRLSTGKKTQNVTAEQQSLYSSMNFDLYSPLFLIVFTGFWPLWEASQCL